MSEPLYVDPEALGRLSRPYNAAAQDWLRLKAHVADIKARYYGAWGDDDLGQQFGPQFTEGLNQIEERVNILGETLNYYGDGLTQSGLIYGEARDDADDISREYVGVVDEVCAPGAPAQRRQAVRAEEVPGRVQPGLVMRAEEVPAQVQPGLVMRAETRLAPARIAVRSVMPGEVEPLAFTHSVAPRERADGLLEPGRSFMMNAERVEAAGEPRQARMAVPGPVAAAHPPAGEFWNDGHWLYLPGGGYVALQSLESPYDHGAAGQVYEPGTVPQPASGVRPPAGQLWSDGVYLYSSDGAIRGLDTLDSPYDHL